MAGTITDEDRTFVETWENLSPSMNDIIRLDRRGEEVHELIAGARTFMITTEERLITQDRILNDLDDPFLNGAFRPVVVPDSVSFETNPNALSDDELRSVLVSSPVAWEEWMKVSDSTATVQRMVDLADSEESDLDLSHSRYKALTARLEELNPKVRITQKDQEQYDKMGGGGGGDARRRAAAKS